jgi:predicted  nucleic acid-binding Zn-ribbon protein
VAIKERHDALEADRRTRSGQLEMLEEHRRKYMEDLMQVQNQREYAAMLKEIDTVKSQIAENEDSVLKDMEELETVRRELADHEAHIQAEREVVAQESAAVRQASGEATERIARIERDRAAAERELPATLVATVHRLERGRQGTFLVQAHEGICQSCFVRVRPQVFQEIKLAAEIHACGSCKRLLYHAPSLLAEPARAGEDARNRDGIEAVNGGPV